VDPNPLNGSGLDWTFFFERLGWMGFSRLNLDRIRTGPLGEIKRLGWGLDPLSGLNIAIEKLDMGNMNFSNDLYNMDLSNDICTI
jgi:hypothetical protein